MHKNEVVYHGSQVQGLKVIEPNEAGFNSKYVFATDNILSAVIFLSRKRNSMQASWDVLSGKPFFCERSEGVFDKWYSGVSGSVYLLPKNDFGKDKRIGRHEFVSSSKVAVVGEVKVPDAGEFLLDKIKVIRYKDRRRIFADDKDLIKMCINGLSKYSVEFTLKRIRELQPSIEDGFLKELSKEKHSKHKKQLN